MFSGQVFQVDGSIAVAVYLHGHSTALVPISACSLFGQNIQLLAERCGQVFQADGSLAIAVHLHSASSLN